MCNEYSDFKISVLQPLKKLEKIVTKTDIIRIEKFYPSQFKGKIRENDYLVVREYNQPKHNIMPEKLLDLKHVVSIFGKRKELSD